MSLISEPQRRSPSPERFRGYKLERELDMKERANATQVDTTFGFIQSNIDTKSPQDTDNNQLEDNFVNKINLQFNNKNIGK